MFLNGDKVRCVKNEENYYFKTPEVGKVYTIVGVEDEDWLFSVKGISGSFDPEVFELVKGAPVKGVVEELDALLLAELKQFEVTTLDENLLFHANALEIGCQDISPEDALAIADKIYQAYGS